MLYMLPACRIIPTHKPFNGPIKAKTETTFFGYPLFPAKPDEQTKMDTSVSGVVVLMYHHLLEANEKNNAAVISSEQFQAQMKLLHDNKYQVIPLPTLEQYVIRKIKLPVRSNVLTFDDGLNQISGTRLLY
ncbi:hypothetical protein PP175_12960 [Aneurinibacillus sp. Ricciae_BoGa-3]|uniref:hypothetical protein n=1 Tax=Aneurinibacillus sp. Ricciae_BoGa-3 TaxID=3022697 RepID=UPI002340AAF4|nr:hypothetical protein [Aneurinibacillus sp. Ricciae_BoGa-3]WCK52370.1 hypothetical protein PP175_12960 [Aneurinibacillus sp. Ricciae_BoGa-3]